MPTEVILPKVDMDMTSGRIVTWHVAEGAVVSQGAPLFDIETDKAAMEVESPASGRVHHQAALGIEVAIGTVVAWIYAEGEAVGPPPEHVTEKPVPRTSTADAPRQIAVPHTDLQKPRATPAARKAARDLGLDLATVSGTGPRGRVMRGDVGPISGLNAESGTLAVIRDGGTRGVPLVLLHGLAGDRYGWEPLMAELPSSQPVIRVELPNHGTSARMRADGFSDVLRQLRNTFDTLDCGPVHLVGHSLGGALALGLSDTRPRQVARLTLLAPSGLGPEVNGPALDGLIGATRAESLGPWLKALVADPDLMTPSFVEAAMRLRQDASLRAAQAQMAAVLFPDGTQAMDLTSALDRLEMPTRIIWGRRDRIVPWKHALRAPGRVSLNLFDNVGHLPHIEAAAAVARFLMPADQEVLSGD